MTLRELEIGKSAIVEQVGGEGSLRQHFLDMGVIPGAEVTAIRFAPMGDPMELRIHGYELTLRLGDAEKIEIREVAGTGARPVNKRKKKKEPPGLGEEGRFHSREDENPLPDGTLLSFALVGNQNSGKTTLFNQLTGANQHVGNFPGVTVDRKDGPIRKHADTRVTDLPGIYSMSPYSSEELVSRNFVLDEKPKAIINIVDATNIERNLYLTMQLLELDIPMVVALNMMDEMTANRGAVDINEMETMLGVPVVPISAAKNEGVDELVKHAVHIAHYQEKPSRQDFCDENDDGGAVHRCLHAVMHLIEDHAAQTGIPLRFAASKLIEGDGLILKRLGLDANEEETLEHIVLQMEKERGLDRSAAIADMRFRYIGKVCEASVTKPGESREHARSQKIDSILSGRFTAIPLFIVIMGTVFFLTFNVIGALLQGVLESGIDMLKYAVLGALDTMQVNDVLKGLIIDGIFEGVGSVLSFLPIIVTLFFFLSILEDSGYMARVAFVTDNLLRKVGLSGRSIVPLLIGFGCSVPAIMSTRTLPSSRDRKMTILLTPYISCSAKIPIYGFLTSTFFPGRGGLVLVIMYLLGIVVGTAVALLMKVMPNSGKPAPFVMELPTYRMPGAKNVLRLLWDKAKDFIQRAFTIIFLATVVIWILQSFNFRLQLVDPQESMLAQIAGLIAPIFRPLGLGDWRIVTALISGFLAKESVVASLEVLDATAALTALTAVPMLVFCLLYTPCVAAIASVKRELGGKWAGIMVAAQCAVAWVVALLAYLLAQLFI